MSRERLSSGLRINRAADDSAGLAIAQRMDAQLRGQSIAKRNVADGVSLVQTAESGVAEITSIIQRLRELAVQAANDSMNSSDRATIKNESEELINSINQIASSTEFNGKKLLDGTNQNIALQIGANNTSNDTMVIGIQNVSASAIGGIAIETFAPVADLSEGVILGNGDMLINDIKIGASDGFAQAIGQSGTNEQRSSAFAKGRAIRAAQTGIKVKILASQTAHSYRLPAVGDSNYGLRINDVQIFSSDLPANIEALVARINGAVDDTGVRATAIDSANYRLTAIDGRNMNFAVTGGIGATGQGWTVGATQHRGGLRLQHKDKIVIEGKARALGAASNNYTIPRDAKTLSNGIGFANREAALRSLDRFDVALEMVTEQRIKLGTTLNRLKVTASALDTQSENLSAAQSRIMDTDFANESAQLTRSQVIQQAASSMLSQAQQAPRNVLALIQ